MTKVKPYAGSRSIGEEEEEDDDEEEERLTMMVTTVIYSAKLTLIVSYSRYLFVL